MTYTNCIVPKPFCNCSSIRSRVMSCTVVSSGNYSYLQYHLTVPAACLLTIKYIIYSSYFLIRHKNNIWYLFFKLHKYTKFLEQKCSVSLWNVGAWNARSRPLYFLLFRATGLWVGLVIVISPHKSNTRKATSSQWIFMVINDILWPLSTFEHNFLKKCSDVLTWLIVLRLRCCLGFHLHFTMPCF